MHTDPLMLHLAGSIVVIVALGYVLQRLHQPLVVAYLLAGVLLGPHVTGFVESDVVLDSLGSLGIVLLLFFVGMEISPEALIARWKVALVGTGLQIGFTLACVALLGSWLDWQLPRIVLLGFVISLSSTAVVLRLLQRSPGQDPEVAQDVTAVLLAQDLAVVPMLITIDLLRGEAVPASSFVLQGLGTVAAALLVLRVCRSPRVELHLGRWLPMDGELQVFVTLLFCFGIALLSSFLHLSAALGAFLAGLLVGGAQETRRFHEHLKPFEVVLVASFFVWVGLLIDLEFVLAHVVELAALVTLVLVANTIINAGVLRLLGRSWRDSLLGASLLAQVGEFSLVLALVGYRAGIIVEYAYQTTLAVISLSLLASPAWIALVRALTRASEDEAPTVSG